MIERSLPEIIEIVLLPQYVFIDTVNGRHYHIEGCQMIDNENYRKINPRYVIGRDYKSKSYKRCTCVDQYLKSLK